MVKNREVNETEEIGLVTPTPVQDKLYMATNEPVKEYRYGFIPTLVVLSIILIKVSVINVRWHLRLPLLPVF